LNTLYRILLATWGIAGQIAAAAEPGSPPTRDGSYFEDLPIVLTASRLPQPLNEAPAAVTVIDRELIQATGYRDIARLLRLVPGMQVGQERAGTQWVTYHGLGNDAPGEMQVLVDGRAVYSPTSLAGVDWQTLPVTPDEIERIEVVRGTNPVAYGPNAFLGAINIITRHAADAPGEQATVNLGTPGIADVRLGWNRSQGDHALRVAAVARKDSGFADLNDGSRVGMLSLRSDSRITDRDELTLRLAVGRDSRGAGYPDSLFGNNGERTWHNRTEALHAQWRHSADPGEELLVNFFRNRHSATDEWLAMGPRPDLGFARIAPVSLDRDYQSTRDSFEFQHRFNPAARSQLVWGGEVRHETVESPFMFYGRGPLSSHLVRVFSNLEQRFSGTWTVNLGGMAEKHSDDQARISPRLFANWQADPDTTLRGGLARAWRDRNAFERYGDVRAIDAVDGRVMARPYLPNPGLRPPRIDSAELGFLGRFRPAGTTVDLRLFNERITDFVYRAQQPPTADNPVLADIMPSTRYENLGTPVTLRGIEYQIRTRPQAETQFHFNHSLIQRHTTASAVADLVAPYTASLSWLQGWSGGWSSIVTLLRMGPLAGGDGFVPRFRYRAPAYTTTDLRIAHKTFMGDHLVEVALAATNLGPKHQEIADRSEQFLHPDAPVNQASRMVFLSLTIGSRR
jgi:iron complex outermembrane receptor protein